MGVFKKLLTRTMMATTAEELDEIYEDIFDDWIMTGEETKILLYFVELKYREVTK